MTTRSKAQGHQQSEHESGTHAIPPAAQAAAPTAEQAELTALRALADAAELSLEFGNELNTQTGMGVLREALRCAKDDFESLGLLIHTGEGIPALHCLRAERRLELALMLSEYRDAHGYPNAKPEYQGTIPPLNRSQS